ncbi:MAG: hypothetical protein ACKVIF_06455, partial [Rhodospirillales bacterium]
TTLFLRAGSSKASRRAKAPRSLKEDVCAKGFQALAKLLHHLALKVWGSRLLACEELYLPTNFPRL